MFALPAESEFVEAASFSSRSGAAAQACKRRAGEGDKRVQLTQTSGRPCGYGFENCRARTRWSDGVRHKST